jgi:septal ring factor EnvC (AmiA/AmiB activator)
MTVSEKIVQSTMLQAVARVGMALSLPLVLMAFAYVGGMSNTLAGHTTNIALLQQEDAAINRRLDQYEKQTDGILALLTDLTTDSATTKRDVGYLRDWVEELKRGQKAFQ